MEMDGRRCAGPTVCKTRRRDFVKAVGAGALLATVGIESAGAAHEMTDFVESDGTTFVLDSRPVYFNGTNNFWITDSHATRQRVDDVFDLFDDVGIDLVRTWAHCEGQDGHCLQPELGVYDEAGLQHLDYVVATAKRHGIRLVIALADNWDHDGGIPKYVEWIDGLEDHGDFYTTEVGREAYRNHAETILTRTNTITGIEYRNEPAIAMWELCNEPRLESDQAANVDDHQDALHEWFADMSAYIKELDPNHLVSTGAEGFYTREDGEGENWMYDDWTGSDYVRNHSIETIDVCSFHMYPHWWDGLGIEGHFEEDDFVSCVEWIRQHVVDAHEEVGKPAYCGEFNVNAERGLEVRNDALERWYDTFDEYDIGATLPWQLVLEETDDHDGFQLYRSESGHILESYGDAVASKIGGTGPVADATSPETLRVGETGEFNAAFSMRSGREITGYEWAFDDGTTASGELVRHAFDEPGEYEVELTVTDETGTTVTDTESVTVEGIPDDSFVVEGAGRHIHEDVNEFHFAYRTVTGDFVVETRVATMGSTDPSAQAGIMALADLEAEGAIGGVAVSPSEGTELVRSYDETTPTWRERLRGDRAPPLWLRLERTDDVVTGYASEDGEAWTELESGQVDFDVDQEVFLGLFVSSNSADDLCTVQFDRVEWLAESDWQHTDVGAVHVPGGATAGTGTSETDDGPPPIDGYEPADTTGDGLYNDVTGSGSTTTTDVTVFFENLESSAVADYPEYYDFDGNGRVSISDVIELFESL